MAETIKSALFVDYDSIHRSLKAGGRDASERFAQRASVWLAAIESGRLVTPRGFRRRVIKRRCYADPRLLGKNRISFIASGFEVVDCLPSEGHERNAGHIHMVLDVMDAMDHEAGYNEFALLSADADLTPVLLRLRAHEKSTLVYANEATAAEYRANADSVVEETDLIGVIGQGADTAPVEPAAPARAPAPQPRPPAAETRVRAAAPAGGDRAEIEALARKVNGATNVPMLSPRAFADLFRFLAEEIAASGYHFQETAENVAAKLTAAGRNVTRRQVVFVVKGLALKGHVFSTTDTADRLAEVFREQAFYLINNAGLDLAARERDLLPAWITGRAAGTVEIEPEAARPALAETTGKAARRRPAKPAPQPEMRAERAPPPEIPQPQPRIVAPPQTRVVPPAPPPRAPAREGPPARSGGIGGPTPAGSSVDAAKKAAAARVAAAKMPPTPAPRPAPMAAPKPVAPPPAAPSRAPAAARTGPRPAPPPTRSPPPQAARAVAKAAQADSDKEALESSILAAIAQAVDVLVEDSSAGAPEARKDEAAAPDLATPEPQPEAAPGEGGDSDDIGDEIQRIIASYSRARQQGDGH
jgi:hypothetical protein